MKILRFLLFPFAIVYYVVTTVRNFFFDIGVFKQTSFNIPIIVVGNLSVGGTGKTPQVEYLIRLLNTDYKVAVLSRGYKRKTSGFVLLNESHTAEAVGDEPLQYFKKFNKITVAVDANRVEGVGKLILDKEPEVILLDDAFQHRKIKASFYILLTKYNDLFIDDYLLPTGNLREGRKGAKRANSIIVTKCPNNLTIDEQEKISAKLKYLNTNVFFTTIAYGNIISKNRTIKIDNLSDYKILLITGIANPSPLIEYLNCYKIDFKHLKYSDHHHFSSKEIQEINKEFHLIESEKKIILTTEKDYVRLNNNFNDNLYYITIETKFLGNSNNDFNKHIIDHIEQNRC